MNPDAKLEFDRITSLDIPQLTTNDILFLKARRSYLNPAQRMAYESLKLFEVETITEITTPKGKKK